MRKLIIFILICSALQVLLSSTTSKASGSGYIPSVPDTLPRGVSQDFGFKYYKFKNYLQVDSGIIPPTRATTFTPYRPMIVYYNRYMWYFDTTANTWHKMARLSDATGVGSFVDSVKCVNDSLKYFLAGVQYYTGQLCGAGLTGSFVDTIYRVPGKDSIYFSINGADYKIKDSTGGSSYTFNTPLANSSGTVSVGGLSSFGSSGQLVRSTGTGWEYFTPTYILPTDTAAMLANYVQFSRTLSTGYGLTGGGNLSANRTFVFDSATVFPHIRATIPNNYWGLSGTTALDSTVNWFGTNDSSSLRFKVNGRNAGWVHRSGIHPNGYSVNYTNSGTFFGALAGNTLIDRIIAGLETGGRVNTGIGAGALMNAGSQTDTTRLATDQNVAVGIGAMHWPQGTSFVTGTGRNVAVGESTLYWALTPGENTAIGTFAIENGFRPTYSTAVGSNSLRTGNSVTGATALGAYASHYNGCVISGATITAGGTGYTTATVTFSAPFNTASPGACIVTATGTAVISGGAIVGITITNPGCGYNNITGTYNSILGRNEAPTITITGDGTGATATPIVTCADYTTTLGHAAAWLTRAPQYGIYIGKDAEPSTRYFDEFCTAFGRYAGIDGSISNLQKMTNAWAFGTNAKVSANRTMVFGAPVGDTTMNIVINGKLGDSTLNILDDNGGSVYATGGANFLKDSYFNSVRIGRGNSSISTNTAIGDSTLGSVTSSPFNTGIGQAALRSVTSGTGYNTAIGYGAGRTQTTQSHNTAVGAQALSSLTNGAAGSNVAIGSHSLTLATGGFWNTAIGRSTMYSYTTPSRFSQGVNTVVGANSGYNLTGGEANNFFGERSGNNISTGVWNVAIGNQAIGANATGVSGVQIDGNVAVGILSQAANTSGNYTTSVGYGSGRFNSGNYNLYIGTFDATGVGTRNNHGYISDGQGNVRIMFDSLGRVGIGNGSAIPTTSSILELVSTTRGFLAPRMTATQRGAISSPANGLLVWDSDSTRFMAYNGTDWKGLAYTSEAGSGGGGGMSNPMTTEGDLILGGSSGTPTRLGIGTNGYVLTSNGTTASWQPASGGGITVGTTTITSGTNGRIAYNNSGVYGEKAVTGTGDVVLATSPTITTPVFATSFSLNDGTTKYSMGTNFYGVDIASKYMRYQSSGNTYFTISTNDESSTNPAGTFNTVVAGKPGMSVQLAGSQTADAIQVFNSGATKIFSVDKDGYITSQAPTYSSGGYSVLVRNNTSGRYETTTLAGGGDLVSTNNLSDVANAGTSRTNLGATTVGSNLFTLTNPSALSWLRVNADNTVSTRTAAETLSDIGAVGTTRTITTTAPLAGGGDLSANRSLSLDINSATVDTANIVDEVLFGDTDNSNAIRKMTLEHLFHLYVKEHRRRYAFDYINEFLNTPNTSALGTDIVATNSGTGAASATQTTDGANRIGLLRTTTGTTATGRSYVNTASGVIRLGGGAWVYEAHVNIATLSTSTERYQALFGFFDTYNAANQVDGVYLLYDEGGVSTGSAASANWQLVTTSNSTRTFSTSSTAVTNGAWVKLRVEVNAAGTRADFFVNGTNIGNVTTNIPTASGRELGFGWGMIKSVGTTARTVDVDYLLAQNEYTTAK